LLRLVRNKLSSILADEFAPNMKGYELEKIPRLLRQLDEALEETDAALPKHRTGGLTHEQQARLSTNEVLTVMAMLERAGCKPDTPDRECVCKEDGANKHDLAAMTVRISESLTQDNINLYGLQGLAKATLALHQGLGLVPWSDEDGIDWKSFSKEELYYLDAVVRKAEGRPLVPPVMGIPCRVCGYSTEGPASSMRACPVGCSAKTPR
jgi:hypothetical protein